MIITKDSHCDHGLTVGQLDFIKKKFADRQSFFIETIELPEELGTVEVSLIGPVTGHEPIAEADVTYQVRTGRKCASRVHRRSESVLREERGLSPLAAAGDPRWAEAVEAEIADDRIEKVKSRLVTVIAGPHIACPAGGACTGAMCADYDAHVDYKCVLYTAFGGPKAPREPGDPDITSWEELKASREFWSQHALVW